MQRRTVLHRTTRGVAAGLTLAALVAGCAAVSTGGSSTGSASPTSRDTSRAPASTATKATPVSGEQATRIKNVMVPLMRVMDHPLDPSKVKIGILDDTHINAASAGGGEFYVTRGLLEKANDAELSGVLAHELAHDDLGHVAKAQRIGTLANIGMVILDQISPALGAVASIPAQIGLNKYTQREEYQADAHGAELLQRAGSSKQVMIDTLTWLTQVEGTSGGGFFATHPATGDRIQALKNSR
jgi:predicted Zn-dependent protease